MIIVDDCIVSPPGNLDPGFERVCEIKADLSGLPDSLVPIEGENGTYYKVYFKIRITFGDTELKAYIEWQDEVCE